MSDPTDQYTHEGCSTVREVLSLIGEKWSVLVGVILGHRQHRFGELKRLSEGISARMLTRTLRNLECDGLITRTVTPVVPPRVDYALTELGRSLTGPVQALHRWAVEHVGDVDSARAQYDAEQPLEADKLAGQLGREIARSTESTTA